MILIGWPKNYTEEWYIRFVDGPELIAESKNYSCGSGLGARVSRGEQGESQRRGDGMHSTRTSTALFDLTEGVTANNHFDRIFEKIAFTKITSMRIAIIQL